MGFELRGSIKKLCSLLWEKDDDDDDDGGKLLAAYGQKSEKLEWQSFVVWKDEKENDNDLCK